jgi:hypothetical protein
MFRISDATKAFATIDKTPDKEAEARLDKALRHLSQRVTFTAAARDGRADLYPLPAICALRLLHKASAFGLEAARVKQLSLWLQNQPVGPARRVAVEGGFRSLSPIEEGIQRVQEGQIFDITMILETSGQVSFDADWPDDDQESAAKVDALYVAAGLSADAEEQRGDVRLVLPASRLLKELLAELGA